jgi:tetratricopeptide (TPR) repeat protein
LAKFHSSQKLLKAFGRLSVSFFRYDDASSSLAQVEAADPADVEAHYYRGLAEEALGHAKDARTEFETAYGSASMHVASGLQLAELDAQEHDLPAALKVLGESCAAPSGNLRCIEETVALERLNGNREAASHLAYEALERNPTSLFLRNEMTKLGSESKAGFSAPDPARHLAGDTRRILNLAIEYNRLGMYADSLELLSRSYPHVAPEEVEPGASQPSEDALLAYYRGYCRVKLGQSGDADFKAASQMPLRYIFPNEAEAIPVLDAALASNSSDVSAHFLLGMLWFSKGMADDAMEEWKKAEALNEKIPSLDASMGHLLLTVKQRPKEAEATLTRGLQADSGNPEVYILLNEAMRQMDRSPEERVQMMKRFPDMAAMPADLLRALTDALRESGKDAEADSLLAHHFVVRKEGEAPLKAKDQAK